MNERPITLRRWLFEVAMTVFLILGGFAAAGFLTELIAPRQQAVYGLALCVCFMPTWFWLRYCGIEQATRVSMVEIFVALAVTLMIVDFVPPAWNAKLWVSPVVFGATHWLFEWNRKRQRRSTAATADSV
jgi:hypothetical protein